MSRRVKKRSAVKRFNRAPTVDIPRSTFDLSFPWKTCFDSGLLIPIPPIEVLPGDSIALRLFALTRLATPIHPTMDNLRLSSFFFFGPNRLAWKNWQKFMGEQENPGDSTDYTIPQMVAATYAEGSTWDYMGVPTNTPNPITISAIPNRLMARCWNEWFRDENLQDSIVWDDGDGPDLNSNYGLKRRGKRKDYVSSCLPWPQKGPATEIPIGTAAPVLGIGIVNPDTVSTNPGELIRESDGSLREYTTGRLTSAASGIALEADGTPSGYPTIWADLSAATGATINDWREAFQIQKLKERDARGGTRYVELLQSHFRVISPDFRLQRIEYLGGGVSPVEMRSVPQTSSTDATTPQGNLSAYGESHVANHGFTKSFVEHGYIIGFVSVQADINYQQRLDRHWSRLTKYDFYWPALQALGEQPVYNREVYADGSADDDLVWGYQERWAEYRTSLGKITNAFRSNSAQTLDAWHYALDFQTRPALNNIFVEDTPPVKRTVALTGNEPEFIMDAWFDIKAARPMPVYSVPGYIDHF